MPLLYSNTKRTQKVPFFPDEDKVVLNHLGIRNGEVSLDKMPDITLPENPNNYRSCLFKCVTEIANGELRIVWGYSRNQYKEETVEKLVVNFLIELREIISLDF